MFKKILVCLDGSDLAEQILPYVVAQASHFESKITLFRAYSEPSITSIGIPGFPAIPTETSGMEKQAVAEADKSMTYLEALALRLSNESGIQAESITQFGGAGQVIVDYATENEFELIAISTHGRSGLVRAVIGSVADYVIRHTHIPILLIKPSEK
jgi:nucleotide-binding universal stress UspA family protein